MSLKTVSHCQPNNGSCNLLSVFKRDRKGAGLFPFQRGRKQRGFAPAGSALSTHVSSFLLRKEYEKALPHWEMVQGGRTDNANLRFCSRLHFRMQRPISEVERLRRLVWPRPVPCQVSCRGRGAWHASPRLPGGPRAYARHVSQSSDPKRYSK